MVEGVSETMDGEQGGIGLEASATGEKGGGVGRGWGNLASWNPGVRAGRGRTWP
jgi:hypothetical protein